MEQHAYWAGDAYSSWVLPRNLTVGGICGTWSEDFFRLHTLLAQCTDLDCRCKTLWQHNVCVCVMPQ